MNRCPARETLDAFVDGSLGPHTAAIVAPHIDDCAFCRGYVREHSGLQAYFAATPAPEVPYDLVANVIVADRKAGSQRAGWPAQAIAGVLCLIVAIALTLEHAAPLDLDPVFAALNAATTGMADAIALTCVIGFGAVWFMLPRLITS